MSYSSWFERILIAFLYPLYPASLVAFTSNPYKLAPVEYPVTKAVGDSFPVTLTISGLIPSSPPWKGTVNLSCEFSIADDESEALNEPDHILELECPK